MNLPHGRPLDPEAAIWKQDLAELARAVEAGWGLPYVRVQGGSVQDLTLVIRIVSLRWTEGWRVLTDRQPELKAHPVLIQLAVRRGAAGIVEDILASGVGAQDTLESGFKPLDVLINALGGLPGEPVEDSDVVATAQALVAGGASALEPYPGVAVAGGAPPEGHTIWTRAIYFRRWEIALAFLPPVWDDVLAMPHGLKAVADLRESVGSGDKGARRLWAAWAGRFLEPWLRSQPSEPFSGLEDLEVVLGLGLSAQQAAWERWDRVDETGWTPLHDLALSGNSPVAHRTLALLVQSRAPCLKRWTAPAEDGMRPCDLWEIANGRAFEGTQVPTGFDRLPELSALQP